MSINEGNIIYGFVGGGTEIFDKRFSMFDFSQIFQYFGAEIGRNCSSQKFVDIYFFCL